jgi:tryptophanyl-tRNA synthetase
MTAHDDNERAGWYAAQANAALLACIADAEQTRATAAAAMTAAVRDRDAAIREALAVGIQPRTVIAASGLSRARIYQIRAAAESL